MLATILVQVSVQAANSAAAGSQMISVAPTAPANPSYFGQPYNIIGQVSISSATLNAAAQSAFLAAGGSLT